MIKGFVYLDRIKNQAEYDRLVELAAKDEHGVFVPAFSVKRNGNGNEPIGWFSLGTEDVPIVFAWLSTEHVKPRESFTLVNQIENLVALKGSKAVCFPIPKNSPFFPIMESLGYVPSGEYTFFVKKL